MRQTVSRRTAPIDPSIMLMKCIERVVRMTSYGLSYKNASVIVKNPTVISEIQFLRTQWTHYHKFIRSVRYVRCGPMDIYLKIKDNGVAEMPIIQYTRSRTEWLTAFTPNRYKSFNE